jgi:ferric-chelate reductase (NADPH)|nr:siderophore-interacting protein [Neorhizobium tomejilense]
MMSVMERNPHPFIAHAVFPGIGFEIVKSIILREAQQQGLPIIEENGCVGCRTDLGEILVCAASDGLEMTVTAAQSDTLQLLRDEIGEHLLEVAPEIARVLRWKTVDGAGVSPPGFRLCKVVSVTPLGPAFLRVRLSGRDLQPFTGDAIHFRLIQPPCSGPPSWPYIGNNGRTVWPTGDGALHRPVYTVRNADPDASWIEFDVFRHLGGRTGKWAEAASADDVVGIMGLGRGKLIQRPQWLIVGDEAAFPAIARLLEAQAVDITGSVFLLETVPGSAEYPIPTPAGVSLTRLRVDAIGDWSAVMAALPRLPHDLRNVCVWFAAGKDMADDFRNLSIIQSRRLPDLHIAAYWS